MFSFVTSLFGCSHRHCTFPMTPPKHGRNHNVPSGSSTTYVVCLDCGREFPYDWQQMRMVATRKTAA